MSFSRSIHSLTITLPSTLSLFITITITLTLSLPINLPPQSPPPKPTTYPPLHPNFLPHLRLQGHTAPIAQVAISPNTHHIASCSADGTAKIWDLKTGKCTDTLVGHMAGVSCLAWAPDSNVLATGGDDKAIRLWDRVSGGPAHGWGEGEGRVFGGAGSGGGLGYEEEEDSGAIGGTMENGIGERMTRPGGGVGGAGVGARGSRKPLLGHHNYVYCLAFSPKGNMLASGSYDEAVMLWDVRAGRLMRSLPAHSDPVSGIDFCVDGTLVASCSTDGLIRIWDTATGQCLRTLVFEENPPVSSVRFSPNGRYVLAFSLDSAVRIWDFINMPATVKKTYQGHVNKGFSIGGCFGELRRRAGGVKCLGNEDEGDEGSDGQQERGEEQILPFIASASEDGAIVLWDVSSKNILQRIEGAHQGVCFSVDVKGGVMVSCGQDMSIAIWRHEDDEEGGTDTTATEVVKLERIEDAGGAGGEETRMDVMTEDDEEEQLHAQLNGHGGLMDGEDEVMAQG